MACCSGLVAFFCLFAISSATLPTLNEDEFILTGDVHNYYNCPSPTKAITVLLDETVVVDGRWFAQQSRTIQFSGSGTEAKRITCIKIQDLDANGRGGYPFVTSGGVNNYDATIRLVSQRGRGLNFRVQLFAA